jgi:glycosyltransferase involved in cell wall biosynthesis
MGEPNHRDERIQTADQATIALVAPPSSLGIRWYAGELTGSLIELGQPVRLVDRAQGRHRLHLHLGNSTRSLIPAAARAARPGLVTVHDVVPRDQRLRRFSRLIVPPVLAGHQLVAHSRYAEDLLRSIGVRGQVHVIRCGARERRVPAADVELLHADLSPDGRPIALTAGVLKEAKGVRDVIEAAQRYPGVIFAFAGDAADQQTQSAIASAPANVVHRGGLAQLDFERMLAAADVLLNFRRDSVGEASGPVVLAHGLGTPVAGYAVGSLPEYCGHEDSLFEMTVPVADALADVIERLERGWQRLPLNAPQVTTWLQSAQEHARLYGELGWT